MRNREIAQQMFVSVRTVELRLTHIYRALGVHSRAQLVAHPHRSRHRRRRDAPPNGTSPTARRHAGASMAVSRNRLRRAATRIGFLR